MKKSIRHQAVDILNTVSRTQAFAADLLDACLDRQGLSETADGRLLTHLVYGVLRMQAHLDWILAGLYHGNYSKTHVRVKNILRTGLYQLKFSDRLPAFAVVDEAVKTAKKIAPAAAGLTNALLRAYLRNPEKISFPSLTENLPGHIAACHSHPLWLVKHWLDNYGAEETIALCRHNNESPPPTFRVNTLKISRPALMEKIKAAGFHCRPTDFSPDGITANDWPLPVRKTEFFKEGLLRIQDEASQLVSYLAFPAAYSSVLDVCAGSGGKTTHLACLMSGRGRITALDRDQHKLVQLEKEAARLGITTIDTAAADLNNPLPGELHEKFDYVFVDAPCSGAGTLARHPEIKWRLTQETLPTLAAGQKNILHHAATGVKKGGLLVYCTCSMLLQENDEVVHNFLSSFPHFSVWRPETVVLDSFLDQQGFFRTYPHRHGMDGFFGAVLRRLI